MRRVHPMEIDGDVMQILPSTPSAAMKAYQGDRLRHHDWNRTADETKVTSRTLRRHPTNRSDGSAESQRPAAENMMSHVQAQREGLPTLKPGVVVDRKNLRLLFGARGRGGCRATAFVERGGRRRDSQQQYAEKTQTVIIFDWDDTLFPTAYVRHDLGLSTRKHLRHQDLRPDAMSQVQATLARAAGAASQLLRLAARRGKVVIVTLARSPWVTASCMHFYPGIGELIDELGIQVVYAQEGQQVEYDKVDMMATEQFETFWAEMKGKAIAEALREFYSQYEGQSWKNIISLGDSDFERWGAMAAARQYAEAQGLVSDSSVFPGTRSRAPGARRGPFSAVGAQLSVSSVMRYINPGRGRRMSWEGTISGQKFKVRTKTFKMLDEPTVEELVVELNLLHQWLPMMVMLNDSFDVDLNSLDDKAHLENIENTLRPLDS